MGSAPESAGAKKCPQFIEIILTRIWSLNKSLNLRQLKKDAYFKIRFLKKSFEKSIQANSK
jgi:hypothetical protein